MSKVMIPSKHQEPTFKLHEILFSSYSVIGKFIDFKSNEGQ